MSVEQFLDFNNDGALDWVDGAIGVAGLAFVGCLIAAIASAPRSAGTGTALRIAMQNYR